LYSQANARFHINQTINHTTGSKICIIGFKVPLSVPVIHDIAVNTPNNNAHTQTPIIIPIKILPKNDQMLTSFGALSNIATSGLFVSLTIF
jgi:hypothetical protein